MNLTELQIAFQQKIEDTNPIFKVEQRPETYVVLNYINKAVGKYLEKKYLLLPTFQHRIAAIEQNIDELRFLIIPDGALTASKNLAEYNWSGRGNRYRTPDDVFIPLSLPCTVSRNEVYPMVSQTLFAQWASRIEAQRLISNTADKVMYPRPLAVFEDPYYIMLIGDAYTTSLTAGLLTYMRKPYKLDFSYTELSATGTGNLTITAITDNTYFLAKARFTYVNSTGTPTIFKPGDKVQKVSGYNTITYADEPIIVGYPWGMSDSLDFPEYMHPGILDLAVSLFLDEAKFKLIPKSS
jgi:hypothetical protein